MILLLGYVNISSIFVGNINDLWLVKTSLQSCWFLLGKLAEFWLSFDCI